MRKVGIFGGTFNPPHLGHLNIATEFITKMGLDEVLVIPTCVPPHKAAPDLATGDLRLDMCRDTFQSLPVTVSSIEIDRTGKSYTVETLEELHRQYGEDTEFYFLVGDDMLQNLPKWYRVKDILNLCTMVASIRSNAVSIEALASYAEQYFPEACAAGKFVFLRMTPFAVSSSEIRERVQQGEPIDRLVTPGVAALIREKGLYLA